MASTLYVDFQGFFNNEDQIFIKEFAVYDAKTSKLRSCLFRPPFEWNLLNSKAARSNRWCSRCCIRLGWNSGDVNYEKINEVVKDYTTNYYVLITKGEEKVKLLQDILDRGVLNLEDVQCPKIEDMPSSRLIPCIYHKNDSIARCAVKNVINMSEWHATIMRN
jgi:hypothetical protein